MLREADDRETEELEHFETRPNDACSLVAARLRRSGYPQLRSVQCEVRRGVARLTGTVPTFHLKQVAQELAAHTLGVWQVENRVQVTSVPFRAGRSAEAG
jgi:osmotically-inducible protein OsmY